MENEKKVAWVEFEPTTYCLQGDALPTALPEVWSQSSSLRVLRVRQGRV